MLTINYSPGPDGIPSCLLKFCADELYKPLTIFFNYSLRLGYFPEVWKTSYVLPFYKNGCKSDITEKPDHWYKHVHRTQRAINSTPSTTTKFSPFEIMFGVRMKNVLDVALNKFLENELVEALSHERDEIRMIAKKQIVEAQSRYKEQFDKKRKEESSYEEGDLVAIKRTQFINGKKLASEFLGPYQVIKCKRHGPYDVQRMGDGEGPFKTSTTCDNIKAWASENVDTDIIRDG